jgi:cytidine kinase
VFNIPAFPMETVVDPTGAGDTFAGGFVGFVARHVDSGLTRDVLRNAMAYGTALASHNVEEFGTERVERLRPDEVHARVAQLSDMTRFDAPALELRDGSATHAA